MKKFFATLTLSVLAFGLLAQENSVSVEKTGPMISIDNEVYDYGKIDQGANGTCEFLVTNTGDQPLIISNCKGSCGCTVPVCDTAPVPPGATTTITVKYDTKRVGPINKSVTINSNAVNAPNKVVRIKGEVLASDSKAPSSPVRSDGAMAPRTN